MMKAFWNFELSFIFSFAGVIDIVILSEITDMIENNHEGDGDFFYYYGKDTGLSKSIFIPEISSTYKISTEFFQAFG